MTNIIETQPGCGLYGFRAPGDTVCVVPFAREQATQSFDDYILGITRRAREGMLDELQLPG